MIDNDNESSKEENNYKKEKEKTILIESEKDEKLTIDNTRNKNNNNYLNKNNDFDSLNNEERSNDSNIMMKVNKGQLYNKNLFVAKTADAIKMEITMKKNDLDYRKYKFNGITIIQNLKDYMPERITRGEIKDMIFNAFGDGLVDDKRYYIPGKTVTRQQANAIVDLIEKYIRDDKNLENFEDKSILDGVNLTIDLVDLNKDIIKEKMFKGKNPSNGEVENIFKNLSQGQNNVKILSIDFN